MKLFLVGGFLGSGKTTAIKNAAKRLLERDYKAGVITNDQGVQLVDSNYFQSFDLPTREVTDGCFCCNYDDLDASIQSLLETEKPEVIFAESVGSCTDIITTVVNPFEQFHPSNRVLLSIFADARVLPVLIRNESHFFDDKVHYIYNKQLEEADLLIINKIDLLSSAQLEEVKTIVAGCYPDKTVLYQNSLDKAHINRWLLTLDEHYPNNKRKSLDIDYDIYGAGEAELGWLDGEVEIRTTNKKAGDAASLLIKKVYTEISEKELPIGHLKFFIKDGRFQKKISFTLINQPVKHMLENYQTNTITILINARVQASPGQLKGIVSDAIDEIENLPNAKISDGQITAFKPGYPRPTHRMIS